MYIPPIKKILDPNKIPSPKNTEDIFYELEITKCTKTLYQTDTIRPAANTRAPFPSAEILPAVRTHEQDHHQV